MLPFTLRVMMRPLSRPSRTRTLTWTASPVMPVRPTTSTTSAGMLSSSAIFRLRPTGRPSLLHRTDLRRDVLDHGLRLPGVEDRDRRRRLAEAHRDAELLLARDVRIGHALLLAQERHVSEDLFGLDVLRHDDELGFAAFEELRDFVRPSSDFPAFLRELDRLIRLVDELLRHLETNVHRLGHCGDLLPPRYAGRHQLSAPRPRRSAARSGAAYKRFATVAKHRSQTTCRRPLMMFIDWPTRIPRRQIPILRLF